MLERTTIGIGITDCPQHLILADQQISQIGSTGMTGANYQHLTNLLDQRNPL